MKKLLFTLSFLMLCFSCKHDHDNQKPEENYHHEHGEHHENKEKTSVAAQKKQLTEKGYQIFDYVDQNTKDTIIMQQYFIAFLKKGEVRSQSKSEADSLQRLHLDHLGRMYELGYADISGPFGDDGDIRGITIYNVPTLEMADSLANSDPMVKAGRLKIEMHPWWAGKGFPLR